MQHPQDAHAGTVGTVREMICELTWIQDQLTAEGQGCAGNREAGARCQREDLHRREQELIRQLRTRPVDTVAR